MRRTPPLWTTSAASRPAGSRPSYPPPAARTQLTSARRRRDDGIDAVFTSDLTRAVETARIAFGHSGVPIVQDARLRECDYGDLNGAPVATLNADRASRIEAPFPGGERYRQVVHRTRDFLRDLGRQARCADRPLCEPLGVADFAGRYAPCGGRRCAVRVAGRLVLHPAEWLVRRLTPRFQ
ncbi:MAG TPA: histidine phosphatase family protein [Dehalococcoidia bacterium]